MKQHQKRRTWGGIFISLLLITVVVFSNCKDDKKEFGQEYDPLKPVEFTRFSPDSGGVGTKMIIQGTNFGNDTSLVKVLVNGKNAKVVGVNGTHLYAVVPARADTGYVSITVGKGETASNHTFDREFRYQFKRNLTTLAGKTDNEGKGAFVDGNLAEAWFREPFWLLFDKANPEEPNSRQTMYVLEWGEGNAGGMRIIEENSMVSTPLRVGGSINRIRSIDFSLSKDTMYMSNDQGGDDGISTVILTRSNGFMTYRPMIKFKQTNFGIVNPIDGEYFFNRFGDGTVYRWDKQTNKEVLQFSIRDNNEEMHMCFSKDGRTVYASIQNKSILYKGKYDPTTKMITNVEFLAGAYDQKDHVDGIGANARFHDPCQMEVGDDNNLYVADKYNHCIRMVTPDGIVSTYAGTPKSYGYIDGEPLKAKFDQPEGLAFGADGALYVADRMNHRIRKILIE